MEKTDIFIVDDDVLTSTLLKNDILQKFGNDLKVTTFVNGEGCIKNINKNTGIVVLDYFMDGINGLETMKSIKKINPNTEVIILSSTANKKIFIDLYKVGARDCITKGKIGYKELFKLLNFIITKPIRDMIAEFSVMKYIIILLSIFVVMGIFVSVYMSLS